MARYSTKVRCPECGAKFKYYTKSQDDPMPDCPNCAATARQEVIPPSQQRPHLVAIRGNAGKALDMAQKIAEEDYGLTNMRDNTLQGETSLMPLTKDQREMVEVGKMVAGETAYKPELANKFFNPAGAAPKGVNLGGQNKLAALGRAGAQAVRGTANDPMQLLHRGIKEGRL